MAKDMQHWVVYLSPAGTTRHVAEVVHEALVSQGCPVRLLDLGDADVRDFLSELAASAPASLCLWIGSPVYVDHAVPLFHTFIDALSEGEGRFAVPFVTWGGVTSGVALPEMAESLSRKGVQVLGAAKVLAAHSSMWGSAQPLGNGHPDSQDDRFMRELVDAVLRKLSQSDPVPLALEKLEYLPPDFRQQSAAKSLALAKTMIPAPSADPDRCTRCGHCVELCPVGAISLSPLPTIGEDCIRCMSCVRECPSQAFPHDPQAVETRLRGMAEESPEAKETAVFL